MKSVSNGLADNIVGGQARLSPTYFPLATIKCDGPAVFRSQAGRDYPWQNHTAKNDGNERTCPALLDPHRSESAFPAANRVFSPYETEKSFKSKPTLFEFSLNVVLSIPDSMAATIFDLNASTTPIVASMPA